MHWAAEWIYARCLGLLINYFNNLAWISVERCQARCGGLCRQDWSRVIMWPGYWPLIGHVSPGSDLQTTASFCKSWHSWPGRGGRREAGVEVRRPCLGLVWAASVRGRASQYRGQGRPTQICVSAGKRRELGQGELIAWSISNPWEHQTSDTTVLILYGDNSATSVSIAAASKLHTH